MISTHFIGALLLGLIPSALWLFFWTREDSEQPEPRGLLVGCFFAGMLAVVFSLFAEQFIAHFIVDISLKYTLWAIVEEVFKFAAVAAVALFTRYNDEPIDAMIYCITVALGFAALENTFFVLTPFSNGDLIGSVISGNLRSVGATLVHVVSSGLIGFGLGLAFYRGYVAKFFLWLVTLAGAITVHTLFNLSILNAGAADVLKSFSWIWVAVVIMIILFEEIKVVRPKLIKQPLEYATPNKV